MKNTYRIFHLIKGLGRGGAETLLQEGMNYADRSRFYYGFGYFLPWKNALVSPLQNFGCEVICFGSKHRTAMFLSIPRVVRFLKSWRADLVHCHLPLAAVVGRIAGKLANIPVIYTEHNVMERYHPWTRRANLWSWKWQDNVVAVSNQVGESIQKHAGNSVPLKIIKNGVVVESFRRDEEAGRLVRRSLNIPENAPIVGTVAVFRLQKNLKLWLAAAALMKQMVADVHFLIVGDGPLRNEIEQEAHSLALDGCIHFPGLQQDVRPYLSAMNLYMISSNYEGLPIALLEAMSASLPVVSTSVGGIAEVVVEGKTGFLVANPDPEALAAHAAQLLNNVRLRSAFGEAGQRRVEEQFSMQRMVHELQTLYLTVLDRRIVTRESAQHFHE